MVEIVLLTTSYDKSYESLRTFMQKHPYLERQLHEAKQTAYIDIRRISRSSGYPFTVVEFKRRAQ